MADDGLLAGRVVVITGAQDAGKEVAEEIAAIAADPPADVRIVIPHAVRTWAMTSGFKGSPALTASRRVTRQARRSF